MDDAGAAVGPSPHDAGGADGQVDDGPSDIQGVGAGMVTASVTAVRTLNLVGEGLALGLCRVVLHTQQRRAPRRVCRPANP